MHELSDQDLKAIIARRDRRFDGRFYFGVKTTRIYCRPVCPARPKPENILIFRSLSEAEKQGYRPCLRCRPDAAPGSKLLDGTMNTVARALRIIQDMADEDLHVDKLAATLGVTDRHLRRLFDEHLGASPIEIMITQRLHFAKQALQETTLPVAEIAFASGFQSLRRFNEAFKTRFRTSPTELRRDRGAGVDGVVSLKIPVRAPYDWDHVISYLKRHETYGVEIVDDGTYRRFITRGNTFGSLLVSRQTKAKQDFLQVEFVDLPLNEMRFAVARLKVLFDTDHNPTDLPAATSVKPGGIRVPASFDPFETAVSVILSQLVSTERAKAMLKSLVERFGRKVGTFAARPVYEFPQPAALAEAAIEEIGVTKVRAGAIRALAKAVAAREIDFKSHADFSLTAERLLAIKGIGPWTASVIAMRCLGNPDAFPELDLIVKRALETRPVDQAEWGSSRAYLAHCIWRDYGEALSKAKKRGA